MHRILLIPKVETTSKGGIVIPKSEEELAVNCEEGIVVAIGETAFKYYGYETPPIKEGDTVWYARYGARVIQFPDDPQVYIACNDEDIIMRSVDE